MHLVTLKLSIPIPKIEIFTSRINSFFFFSETPVELTAMLEFEDGTHHLSNLSFLSKLSDCTNFASQQVKKNIIGTELATQSTWLQKL